MPCEPWESKNDYHEPTLGTEQGDGADGVRDHCVSRIYGANREIQWFALWPSSPKGRDKRWGLGPGSSTNMKARPHLWVDTATVGSGKANDVMFVYKT